MHLYTHIQVVEAHGASQTYTSVYVCVCVYVYVCVHTHTNAFVYTHTGRKAHGHELTHQTVMVAEGERV